MSGGVGPTYKDITLPNERAQEEQQHKLLHDHDDPKSLESIIKTPAPQHHHKSGFFSFRQLNALVVMIVLSASAMVSPEDILFVIFSTIYIYFLSTFSFPSNKQDIDTLFHLQNKILRLYAFVGVIIGLLLPIGYIFHGIFEGDKQGIKAASPHVFLLASQIFMEGVAFSGKFSLPIRVFVPVCYNSVRMFAILEWLRNEMTKDEKGATTRLYVGRCLAIANIAYWSFNLFGFLLPVCLPKAFQKYYSDLKIKD